jgi:hypothetical protein
MTKEEPKQETNLEKHLNSCKEYQGPRRSAVVDKQETLKEAAERLYPVNATGGAMEMLSRHQLNNSIKQEVFLAGAKCQAERMYSEEEVINAFNEGQALNVRGRLIQGEDWFKQFKKK